MRVATDIGGTFTDLVCFDPASQALKVGKAHSTPPHFEEGVVHALTGSGIPLEQALFFVHGTTVIINALTERTGAKTGLITTRGFADVLEIARGNRPDLYNLRYTKPEPFVPRHLRKEATERVNYKGEVLVPLDEESVLAAAQSLVDQGVEAIAICFLHSYAYPHHEARAKRLVQARWPHLFTCASHEITREWREYERTSTTVLNGYVQPVASRYLRALEQRLTDLGYGGVAYVMQSNGGTATFRAGAEKPIHIVESGPVAGVLGAAALGSQVGLRNLITIDIGGTTAKCSLVENGEVKVTTEYKIGWTRTTAGYPIHVPVVDIVEIGAGGGSIGWIDSVGSLHVGPRSAGAVPGPAAYGKGGHDPTVTDAFLALGRINPDYFLGGEIQPDMDAVWRALERVAKPLGVSAREAASGIIRIANANMVNALKIVSVQRGYDPREFTLVAFGGGGAMHASSLARELGIRQVVIPPYPAVFSAWGMLMTDLRYDVVQTRVRRTDQMTPEEIGALWDALEREVVDYFQADPATRDRPLLLQRFMDMRYLGQEHTVKVPVPDGALDDAGKAEIERRFHELHEQRYTFRLASPVEYVNFHVTGFATVAKPELARLELRDGAAPPPKARRRVWFDEHGEIDAPIYERSHLAAGSRVAGPAIVEEPATTIVLWPGDWATVDEVGNLRIQTGVSR